MIQIITDLTQLPEEELLERLRRARGHSAEARAKLSVQLRDPQLSVREMLAFGERLCAAVREVGGRLIVNDRVDVAVLLGADGVHLGRRSLLPRAARTILRPGAWVSVSAHSIQDVLSAADAGADAALLSPIFASPGKGAPLGVGALAEAREALETRGHRLSLLALGGVTVENAALCLANGAAGVAAIRADLIYLL